MKNKKANSHFEFQLNNILLNSKRSNSHFEFQLNNILPNSKRSQSTIVATVLLILLVIVAAVLIFTFVLPFIKERMGGEDCLDIIGKVEISSGYTCFVDDAGNEKMQVQVHIGEIRDSIEGISVELGGATSKNYKIINGTDPAGAGAEPVIMCGDDPAAPTTLIELPMDNEERTYVFTDYTELPNTIRIYPILSGGKTCDTSDTATVIETCIGLQEC